LTSSTESRRTQFSRAGSKLSEFIGRMTMATCSMLCLVGIIFAIFKPLWSSLFQGYSVLRFLNSRLSRSSSG
jgi:hypothetical protein